MADNLDTWLTLDDVKDILNVSEKTVHKYARDGVLIGDTRFKLRKAHRRIPGRRPLAVFHPDDVERVRAATVPVRRVSENVSIMKRDGHRELHGLPVPAAFPIQSPTSLIGNRVSLHRKLYLTLEEASLYSGLSTRHLSELLRSQAINGFKRAGWKVQRASLEKFATADSAPPPAR